jgi:hypothetical protein
MVMDMVVEKDLFLCEQARAFFPDGFFQVLQCCAVAICIQFCPMVQKLNDVNALSIPKCCQQLLPSCPEFLSFIVTGYMGSSLYPDNEDDFTRVETRHVPHKKEVQDLEVCTEGVVDGILGRHSSF